MKLGRQSNRRLEVLHTPQKLLHPLDTSPETRKLGARVTRSFLTLDPGSRSPSGGSSRCSPCMAAASPTRSRIGVVTPTARVHPDDKCTTTQNTHATFRKRNRRIAVAVPRALVSEQGKGAERLFLWAH